MKFKYFLHLLNIFFLIFVLTACGKKTKNQKQISTIQFENGNNNTVMIVDEGIDPKGYEDKIVAHYALKCSMTFFDPKIPFYINYKTKACNQLGHFGDKQACWERNVIDGFINAFDENSEMQKNCHVEEVEVSDRSYAFKLNSHHGTWVLHTLAHHLSDIKLILLQIDFSDQKYQDSTKASSKSISDLFIREISDDSSELSQKYNEMSAKSYELVVDLAKKFEVDYINMSFGEYYGLFGILDKLFYSPEEAKAVANAWLKKRDSDLSRWDFPENVKMAVFAAGNEKMKLDSSIDNIFCDPINSPHIIFVGSLDPNGNQSAFSNHGKCVTTYTLGEVDSWEPNGESIFVKGTSFAAPNFIRQMVTHLPHNATREDAINFYKSHTNNEKKLKF